MKKFTYISDDDGKVHEARRIDWDAVLEPQSTEEQFREAAIAASLDDLYGERALEGVLDGMARHRAWNALQSVPSYVEAQARAFVNE